MIAAALVIIIIPILIYYFLANQATLGEWLGFFGTYFGSAISIGFAYINTKFQLKKTNEKDIVDNLYNILRTLEIISSYLDNLRITILNNKTIDQKTSKQINQEIFNVEVKINNFDIDFATLSNQLKKDEFKQIKPKFNTWFDNCDVIFSIKYADPYILHDITLSKKRDWIKQINKLLKSTNELKLSIAAVYDQRIEKYEK